MRHIVYTIFHLTFTVFLKNNLQEQRFKKAQQIMRRNMCQKIQRFFRKYLQNLDRETSRADRITCDSRL
jgi:hypothetical protein